MALTIVTCLNKQLLRTMKDWLNPLPNLSKGRWSINCCITYIFKEVMDLKYFKKPRSSVPACWVIILIESLHIFIPCRRISFHVQTHNSGSNIFWLILTKWTSPNSTSLPCTTTYKIARLKTPIGLVNDYQPRLTLKNNGERMVYLVQSKKVERKNIQT